MTRRLLLAPTLIAAICLSPGALLRWKIGQSVAAKMPDLLGPARSYRATVSGGLFPILLKQRIEMINIRGDEVKLSNGMKVQRIDIVLKGVHYKPDQTVTKVEATDFRASVTEQNLLEYLASARPDMTNATAEFGDGSMFLSASLRVLGMRTPVSMDGSLEIENGTRMNLILSKVHARGIRIPGFVRGRIMHDINPVIDAEKMGIGLKLKSVKVSKGAIDVTGAADVNKALAAK